MKLLTDRAIVGEFYHRLEAATAASWVGQTSMLFSSDQESETYEWLGQTPAMREWIGGREAKGLSGQSITIFNKDYESTLEIPRRWMERDKTGQIMVRISEQADRAVTHWQKLLSDLIASADSTVCYDGQYFFDTDHSEGDSGTQSNEINVDISAVSAKLHGTTTAPSPEELRGMVFAGVEQMLGFKDDQGEPMNEMAREFVVMVPTAWFTTAAAALRNPNLGGAEQNTFGSLDGFSFSLAVNPRLSWTESLAVMRADASTAPFIRQEENGVQVEVIGEGSEHAFKTGKHLYGISASRAVGLGYWQQAVKATAV